MVEAFHVPCRSGCAGRLRFARTAPCDTRTTIETAPITPGHMGCCSGRKYTMGSGLSSPGVRRDETWGIDPQSTALEGIVNLDCSAHEHPESRCHQQQAADPRAVHAERRQFLECDERC